MAMATIAAYVPESILGKAAKESQLHGASKSQIVRYSLLRLVMDADEARKTIFGSSEEVTAVKGRVDSCLPQHELDMIRAHYPELSNSELIRLALAITSGSSLANASKLVTVKRGRPAKSTATGAVTT